MKWQRIFVDSGYAAEIRVLEKEYGKGVVGDTQQEMTSFQKQVLLLEEERINEEKKEQQQQHAGGAQTLNAEHSANGMTQSERKVYQNNNEFETENQVEFVDTE